MKTIKSLKNPLMIPASLLGMTLAVTGCSTTSTHPMSAQDGKMMAHDDHHGDGHDWHKGGKHHGDEHGDKGQMGMERRLADLNLTDTQKAQIQQLRAQNQAKMQQLKATLDQYDANIASQKSAGASTTALLALYQQKQAVLDQFFALHQQEKQQFMSILTPDQQLKLYQADGEHGHGFMKK